MKFHFIETNGLYLYIAVLQLIVWEFVAQLFVEIIIVQFWRVINY